MGTYDKNSRSIVLSADPASDPPLVLATLVHGVVNDMLCQHDLGDAILPEVVELAVVGTGLGMLRNNIGLLAKTGTFWDSTQWGAVPRPFLDPQTLAYANAVAAWAREDRSPQWARDLMGELKRPMQNSLKFLFKTNDSFFQPSKQQQLLGQSQDRWWELAACDSPSQQIVALRHLQSEHHPNDQQESLLMEKLGSGNRAILLHAIAAVERILFNQQPIASDLIVRRLRILADHRDEEVSAKAMCALTRLGKLDEITMEIASNMLESSFRHVVFAGAYALSSQDAIPDQTLVMVDRCFVRALRACDYEFVGLFATAYNRWLDEPESHAQNLLSDSPEYVPVAVDALRQVPDQLVSIG